MNKLRIVLADDHQILLDGLKSILEYQDDMCIAGTYNNGLSLFMDIENTLPDIALVDINMPGLNGHELTLRIKKDFPKVKVMTLSMFDDTTHIMQLIKAGVSGYLYKDINNKQLLEAVRAVAQGGTWFSPGVMDKVTAFVKAEKSRQYIPALPSLTGREIEILKLVALEYSNAKIADNLFISERTVETHRKNMLRKTNHKNMVGLLKYAFDNHLL